VCLVGSRAQDPEPKRVVRSKKQTPTPEPPVPAGDLDFQVNISTFFLILEDFFFFLYRKKRLKTLFFFYQRKN
jgi:hypothetical protein